MAFLLDTTVLIGIARGHEVVGAWFASQDLLALWLSTITVGELHRGVHQRWLRRAKALAAALGQLREDTLLPFEGRILGLDIAAAEIRGRLMGKSGARTDAPDGRCQERSHRAPARPHGGQLQSDPSGAAGDGPRPAGSGASRARIDESALLRLP
jgi:predicted nucleic acid-binding protein